MFAEHVAVLLHEAVEVRLLAAHALRHQVVQVAHHVLHALQIALGHLLDHLLHVVEEAVGHRLAQLLHQFLELVLRLRVQELVVLELLHLRGRLWWQVVEELLLPLGDAAEHVVELGVRVGRGCALAAVLAAVACLGALGAAGVLVAGALVAALRLLLAGRRDLAVRGLILRGRQPGLFETLRECAALQGHDLVELALDVFHHAAEIKLVQPLPALLAELLEQVAQPLHTVALRGLHPALHQVAQRVLQVAKVHQVVGQRPEHVAGVERRNVLRAVPFGVAVA